MQPSAGRSRGRARTTSRTEPQPVQPGVGPGGGPPPPPPPPPQPSQARIASPARPMVTPAEPGRGRGLQPPSETIPPTASTGAISQLAGSESPKSSDSPSESPPQQHSPPHPASAGRAALRGNAHPLPGSANIGGLISQMERTTLSEGPGEQQPQQQTGQRREAYEQVIHTRPATCLNKIGQSGDPIKILCNFFQVQNKPDFILYQYHVGFEPEIDSKKLRRSLFNEHGGLFPQNKAFDGMHLYTSTQLPDEVTEVKSNRRTDNAEIKITLRRVQEISITSPQFVHLFNIVFRKCLKLYGMKQIDRNYYDMNQKISINQYNLDLINGFATSIATYENQLLLNAELTHKLLHKSTVYDWMYDIYQRERSEVQFREKCLNELVGRVIMTKYNDKTYKIDDISWDENPTSTFPRGGRTPGDISYVEYYRTQYQLDIPDRNQPLLVSLPKERDKRRGQTHPIKLIPSFCILTGVNEQMRNDFRFKRELEQFSKVGPNDRCNRLAKFVGTFNRNERVQEEMNNWRMNFSDQPVEIPGRFLQPETIGYGNNVTRKLTEKADWSGDLKEVKILNPIGLLRWIVVYPQSKSGAANDFIDTYGKIIGSLGIPAEPPIEASIPHDDTQSIINTIKDQLRKNKDLQMVVVLMTSKRKDRYDAIKRICCLELPIPSQVVTTQIIEDMRKRRSVVTKVAIQMNCKLGGEIWAMNIPMSNVMICGIDTYHDAEKKNSSVCAFVATVNDKKTKYFSRATIQSTHQELSNNLTLTVKSACEHYQKMNNGVLPDRVIIYRDGVSDGQLRLVTDYEVPQVQRAFQMVAENYNPGLSVIIVKKRGNARFFAKPQRDLVNPPCGTIIDNTVTRKEWYDFYLISQVVNQGTVNPTHYNVVYDTLALKPDVVQKLTYKMTHLYYNWPGTIRVPATCQYAHKLAYLVGQSLHKEHDLSLCDKLFYL